MSIWQDVLHSIRFSRRMRLSFQVSPQVIDTLEDLAAREGRSRSEMAREMLSMALDQRQAADWNLQRWQELSPREQQVAALACRNYTNRQIAAQLVLSPETIKTHVRNALRKFGLRRKEELRQALAEWDFSAWEEQTP